MLFRLPSRRLVGTVLALLLPVASVSAVVYYVDADGGNDAHPGTSPAQAWATLDRVNAASLLPGDAILLQAGDTFNGKLFLVATDGAEGSPIVIGAYGEGPRPIIDASGYRAGVHLRNAAHIEVRDLEITGDGGVMVDGSPEENRYGVLVDAPWAGSINHILLEDLKIHHIYPSLGTSDEGATPTTHHGYGIALDGKDSSFSDHIVVRRCEIENVGYKGIEIRNLTTVEILDNTLTEIGGPGIQPGRVQDLLVRGNTVDRSGSFLDPRMHGRGSGIWPFASSRVLIERNTFRGARGRADSCGIHIDFNCRDVVVQYNLSVDNAGGFIEILGNDANCAYRYNISINDGWRVKGALDQGTIPNGQEGHLIWTSGYVGTGNPPTGPFNSYLYNNTIYTKAGITGKFYIEDTTDGLLIANNIFYVEGPTADVTAAADDNYTPAMAARVVWSNNLYQRGGIVPAFNLGLFTETQPIFGDPGFASTGGLTAADYIPSAADLVLDRGVEIDPLPGDALGLALGLAVTEDFFGHPLIGLPDLGAIDFLGSLPPLPAAAFASSPTSYEPRSAAMTAVAGPYGTEYFFTETTGNFGGDDSGWQASPVYEDTGLLPHTTYAYTVTLRDALGGSGTPSAAVAVLSPPVLPFVDPSILDEDFASLPNPANATAPYPVATWHLDNTATWSAEDSGNVASVNAFGGGLRVGWGYDEVVVQWFSERRWEPGFDYRLSGDWKIDNVLDFHLGLIVGVGAFDPVSGALLQRVKEQVVGEAVAPTVGQTGTFILDLSAAELVAAGVAETNRIGVFLHHDDDGILFQEATTGRNDVYLVDNLRLVILSDLADADGDAIPDAAEVPLGLDPENPADGADDLDLDGTPNAGEYLAGTPLSDSGGALSPDLVSAAGLATLTLPAAQVRRGRVYILEHSTTLDPATPWRAVDAVSGTTLDPATDLVLQFPPSGDPAFFRLRIEWE